MGKEIIKNRYDEVFTYTDLENGNVLWEGSFFFSRHSYDNNYDEAYKEYYNAECIPPHDHTLSKGEFINEVHRVNVDIDGNYLGPNTLMERYGHLITINKDKITMVDPSGGPYMSKGQPFRGRHIQEFIPQPTGYEIVLKN